MTITVDDLKTRADEIVREVDRDGTTVDVELDGKVIARITPAETKAVRPWEAMHGKGRLLASPEESVLRAEDFEVYR